MKKKNCNSITINIFIIGSFSQSEICVANIAIWNPSEPNPSGKSSSKGWTLNTTVVIIVTVFAILIFFGIAVAVQLCLIFRKKSEESRLKNIEDDEKIALITKASESERASHEESNQKINRLQDEFRKSNEQIILKNVEIDPVSIGNGSFGKTFIGKFEQRKVILKPIKMQDSHNNNNSTYSSSNNNVIIDPDKSFIENYFPQVWEEYQITKEASQFNGNVLSFFGLTYYRRHVYMALEYCEFGSLSNFIENRKNGPLQTRFQLGKSAASALKALSSQNGNMIIHGDVSARNYFIFPGGEEGTLVAKLSDFGISKKVTSFQERVRRPENDDRKRSDLSYFAPEMFNSNRMTIYSDWFAFGVVLWKILANQTNPFPDIPYDNICELLANGSFPQLPSLVESFGKEVNNSIEKLRSRAPQERNFLSETIKILDKKLFESM